MAALRAFSRLPCRALASGTWFKSGLRPGSLAKGSSLVVREVSDIENNEKKNPEMSFPVVPTHKTNLEIDDKNKLCDSLREASCIGDVQSLIQNVSLDSELTRLACLSLNKIFIANRQNPEFKDQVSQFIETAEFKKLVSSMEQHAHMFYFVFLKNALQFCVNFRVPLDSLLVEKVLTLILDNINKYWIQDIASIYHILVSNPFTETETVEALKSACVTYVNIQLEDGRLKMIPVNVLYFISQKSVAENLKVNYLETLTESDLQLFTPLSYLYAMKVFHIQNATRKISSPKVNMFLKYLKQNLTVNWLDKESYTKNIIVLYRLGFGVLYPYDEELCDIFAIRGINANLETATRILLLLGYLSHLNTILLDHVLKLGLELRNENQKLSQSFLHFILPIIHSTGPHYFKNEVFDYYKSQVELCKVTPNNVVSLGLVMALFKMGKEDTLNKICETIITNFETLLERSSPNLIFRVLMIYQWLAFSHPKHAEKFPHELLDTCYNSVSSKFSQNQCKGLVQKLFGGKNYVLENCTTSFKHNLSYVVLLNSDNEPVDLSSYKSSPTPVVIEHIIKPPFSKIIIIQEFPMYFRYLFRNTLTPTALGELYISNLTECGYDAYPIQLLDADDPGNYQESFLQLRSQLIEKYAGLRLGRIS